MATKIIMPKQGLQMTEGTIIRWLAKEGDRISVDSPLFEIETDKLTITIPSPATGTVLSILKHEGDVVPIAQTIAVIGDPGEDIRSLLFEAEGPVSANEFVPPADSGTQASLSPVKGLCAPSGRVFISPRAKSLALEKGIDFSSLRGSGPEGLIIERDVISYAERIGSVKASPLARKIAGQEGVSIDSIHGSGSDGKIMKADVLASIASVATQADKEKVVPFSGTRRKIADRMLASLKGSAQAFIRMKVDMSESLRLKDSLKDDDIRVSVTDIIVKAVASSLRKHPVMNASIAGDSIVYHAAISVGLAVSTEKGIIVPVVKEAERHLPVIAAAIRDLVSKVKDGTILPDDCGGGTFTVSNLGMYGVDDFVAIINPPESGILAVGRIERQPVVSGDTVVIRPIMTLCLTYDHRIIDGAPAAEFLGTVRKYLENPYLML